MNWKIYLKTSIQRLVKVTTDLDKMTSEEIISGLRRKKSKKSEAQKVQEKKDKTEMKQIL